MSDLNNNQDHSNEPKKTHGGKRQGAGRRKGSTNKITAEEFFQTYKKVTKGEYLEDLVKRLTKAYDMVDTASNRFEFESALIGAHKYDSLIAKYLFKEVQQEVDVTSKGEALKATFVFTKKESDDWNENN